LLTILIRTGQRSKILTGAVGGLIVVFCPPTFGQGIPAEDPVKVLVGRLDLEKYKATIKGPDRFGDRREGTDRNRAAVDWIERQLKSFGCNNRSHQVRINAPQRQWRPQRARADSRGQREIRAGSGGSRIRAFGAHGRERRS